MLETFDYCQSEKTKIKMKKIHNFSVRIFLLLWLANLLCRLLYEPCLACSLYVVKIHQR